MKMKEKLWMRKNNFSVFFKKEQKDLFIHIELSADLGGFWGDSLGLLTLQISLTSLMQRLWIMWKFWD